MKEICLRWLIQRDIRRERQEKEKAKIQIKIAIKEIRLKVGEKERVN